jgi:hypothetical protein
VIVLAELGGDSSKDRMRPGAMGPKAAARLRRCRDVDDDVGLFWLEEEAAKLLPWQGPGLVGDRGHRELPCPAGVRTGYNRAGGEGVIAFLAIRARRLEIALDGGTCGRRVLPLALARLTDSFLTCSISSHARRAARWWPPSLSMWARTNSSVPYGLGARGANWGNENISESTNSIRLGLSSPHDDLDTECRSLGELLLLWEGEKDQA